MGITTTSFGAMFIAAIPDIIKEGYNLFFDEEEAPTKPCNKHWNKESKKFVQDEYLQYNIHSTVSTGKRLEAQQEFADYINNALCMSKSKSTIIRIAKQQ